MASRPTFSRPVASSLRRALILGVSVLVIVSAGPAYAIDSRAGDLGPNFTESPACGETGPNRPLVAKPGSPAAHEMISGPWADFFGRSRAQIEGSIVSWTVPGTGGRTLPVHERSLPAFQQVAAALEREAAAGRTYPIGSTSGFAWRTVAGRNDLSNHAFGNAVDLNVAANPYRSDGVLITDMPAWFVAAWREAGFCWGGDWVRIKDPMHFSWMGPHTGVGPTPLPPPYPPLTAPADFTRRALATPAVTGPDGATHGVADRSGDGAADLYSVAAHGGGVRILAAGARSRFGVIGFRADVAATPSAAAVSLLGDHDGDALPDLWLLEPEADQVAVTVYTDADDFAATATYVVPVATTPEAQFGLADFDRDRALDLFVVTPGPPTRVSVWSGARAFRSAITVQSTGLDAGPALAWSYLIGDYDVDGTPDVYAISRRDPAEVRIQLWDAAGYAGPPLVIQSRVAAGGNAALGIDDYDGDGRDDIYVLRSGVLSVYLGGERAANDDLEAWFVPDDPLPWDAGPECLGAFPCDQIGFVDDAARWSISDEVASESDDVEFTYGNPGDVPFLGDWDCDGTETPGLYRRSDGFVYLRNSNDVGIADRAFFFGDPGDLPLAGDFDGDGCDTVSIYRPHEATIYIMNALGIGAAGLGPADRSYAFGDVGDRPFVGDFDGDGVDEVGLHRESTGLVYYRLSHTSGPADVRFVYGDPGDRLLAGDWDGDGTDTLAVFRPADGNWYIKLSNVPGAADHAVHYHGHQGASRPVAGRTATSAG